MTFQPVAGARATSTTATISRRARAHSRIVHLVRWLAPAAIAVILAILAAFVALEAQRAAASRPREIPTSIRMMGPHFLGRDDAGRAFNLAARQASRNDHDLQEVILLFPVLTLDVDGSHPKTVTADHGVYRENTRLLRLTGHVRVDDATASSAVTEEALVDTRAGTVVGGKPVAASGGMGAVEGRSYQVYDKGQRVILRGGVHGRLKGR